MSPTRLAQVSLAVAVGFSVPVSGATFDPGHGCAAVAGNFTEILVDPLLSTFDPFGRVVNFSDGTIQSNGTAILTTVGPGPFPGTLQASTRHLFILSPADQLTATGIAIFTPIPNTNDVTDVLTWTINGGLGKFKKATGQIVATGRGFNFFPLPPGPIAGRTYFVFQYSGQVCVP